MVPAQSAERLLVISDKLDDIVSEIYDVCEELKAYEESKRQLKEVFFDLANEYLEITGTLERKTLEEKWASRAEAVNYVDTHCPGWRVIQFDDGQAVIEEDPAQMKFEWRNPEGLYMSRTTAMVGTTFDCEELKDRYPDIFEKIVDQKIVFELNQKRAEDLISMEPGNLNVLQEMTRLGKIQLRMSSPKRLIDDE